MLVIEFLELNTELTPEPSFPGFAAGLNDEWKYRVEA
jgi:hypothetical protein